MRANRFVPLRYRRSVAMLMGSVSILVATLGMSCGLRLNSPHTAFAAGPRPTVTVFLHFDYFRVRTTATVAPDVRLFDAQGELKAVGNKDKASLANGEWTVFLTAPGDLGRRVVVRPGDRITVNADGQTVSVVAPAFSATSDVNTDVIRGQAPSWTTGLIVLAFADANWNPGQANLPPTVEPHPGGGAYEVSLAGKFDIAPGTWGYVGAPTAEGDVFVIPFAPPTVWMLPSVYGAYVQADPVAAPVLAAVSADGLEHFRSAPGELVEGFPAPRYVISFADPDHPQLPFDVEAGYVLKMFQADAERLSVPVPWLGASVDRQKKQVSGLAPAGTRAQVTLYPQGTQGGANTLATAQTVVVDKSEAVKASFPGASVSAEAVAVIVAFPNDGGSVAFGAAGLVGRQQVLQYFHELSATFAGWGKVDVELVSGGKRVAWRQGRTDALGRLDVSLSLPAGGYTTFMPGDEIRLRPERGEPLTLKVPRISAEVSDDHKTLVGEAPPGMVLAANVYDRDPFGAEVLPYEGPNVALGGKGDVAGRYRLVCPAADAKCLMRYGLLTAYDGAAEYVLQWLEKPFIVVGVSLSSALARATVGTDVILTAVDQDGKAGATRHDLVRPQGPYSLPFWETGLTDLFPEGLQAGSRLRVTMASRTFEVRVPEGFAWQADTYADRVSGTGPPGQTVITQANPRDDPMRMPAAASGLIGLDRKWRTVFQGYDLRAGDDLYTFLVYPAEQYILYWLEESVQGAEPVRPTPTAAPTETGEPTPRPPSPTPTAPSIHSLYLPFGGR